MFSLNFFSYEYGCGDIDLSMTCWQSLNTQNPIFLKLEDILFCLSKKGFVKLSLSAVLIYGEIWLRELQYYSNLLHDFVYEKWISNCLQLPFVTKMKYTALEIKRGIFFYFLWNQDFHQHKTDWNQLLEN